MSKEEKDALMAGYWLKFAALFNNLKYAELKGAKDVKKLLLNGVEIVDKIIELEDCDE